MVLVSQVSVGTGERGAEKAALIMCLRNSKEAPVWGREGSRPENSLGN